MRILPDSISKLLYEPSDEPSPKVTSTPISSILPQDNYTSSVVPLDKLSDSNIYKGLYNKTSPDGCVNLQKYRSMVIVLSSSIPDPTIRNKAALAASGVTVTAISDEILGLRNTLANETSRGKQYLDNMERTTTTSSDADALEKEIAERQNRLVALRATIAEAKNKVQRKREELASAIQQRASDLQRLEQEINSLR